MPDPSQPMHQPHTALADAIRAKLEAARESISRELATIPPPVPACDVNFNCLLEDRAGIVDELQRLAKLRTATVQAADLLGFARTSVWLDADTKARIEKLLGASGSS
jgi:hypothetical protein